MHSHTLYDWRHDHVFLGDAHDRNERRTWLVVGLTAAMMVAEIAGGTIFGSMALLADGWHMSTHAGALAIAAFAYRYRPPPCARSALRLRHRQAGRPRGLRQRRSCWRWSSLWHRLRIGGAALPARADPLRRGDRHRRRSALRSIC